MAHWAAGNENDPAGALRALAESLPEGQWGTFFLYISILKVLRGTICRNLDSVDFKIPINNINRKYTVYRYPPTCCE